ncbi:response regulator [Butyrivibrio sp. FCS014]|uniref:response regulator n=1 Tax=Butyrivibrio sp. FCS014 TaxID=1408304 RepID=UPI0004BCD4F2|nr:transporter substrate-binding domain-containing protein [Butyrivibrio sp. FCS014]
MRKSVKKAAICAIVLLLFTALFPNQGRVLAADNTADVVRVGYYENEVFEEGASPDAVKTGYAYEYYRKLSEYTGWNYEYVYGGFGELYDMLLSGDIDLLAGLAKREDRLDIIGYPSSPMGNEIYTLVKHDDDTSVTYSPSSVSGKRIGVLQSAIVDILEGYLNEQSINAQVVTFDDYESLFDAFDNKEVDILAAEGDGAYGRDHAEVICTFGTSDYYLCVSKSRPDLLAELDQAQSLLAMEDPNYISTLRSKYYSSSVSSHTFSEAERAWAAENSSLKVGYLNNYLPYSSTDSAGNVTGIVKEIIPRMLTDMALTDIEVTYTGYDNYDDMISDIRDEKIDVCFPAGGGLFYSEENGIYQSSPVVSAITELVYKNEYENAGSLTFAVNENNRMQYYYILTSFPEAKIVLFPDIDACLNAVLKGTADATTLNGLRANEILKNSKYKGLYSRQLTSPDDRCFGVKIGNEGLLKLLNRGIKVIGSEYPREVSNHYSDELYTYTFRDMVRDNLWLFLALSLLIALLVIVLAIRDLKRTRLANQMKTNFVSNMSHEIRTPITAILGMNEMIQLESNDEKIVHYSENIEKAGESLLGIINDILDFSKIEAGRMELVNAPYSLPELISELQIMVIAKAEEKDLLFEMQIDEKLPTSPIGDVQKIRQVMTNILSNAAKYTKEGSVKLNVSLMSMDDDSFTMEVAVEDTGIGIRAEDMSKLYSAFDRLDLEKTGTIEGSGLGLAISQNLLSMMNSEIHVTSEYGTGSRFSFLLHQGIADRTPIGKFEPVDTDTGRHHRKRAASFTAPDARILIVDDTPMNLQVVCGLLKGNGMKVDTAESGAECIALFRDNEYDMVFLDQRMPNMDGVETLTQLHKLYPKEAAKTPIVCLTANVLSGGKEMMLKAGFTDYLTKPVTLFGMEQMLLKYLPKEKVHKTAPKPEAEASDTAYTLPEAITSIKQLNIEHGIDYCGDEEEYIEALKVFADSAKEKSARLEELWKSEDLDDLSLLAHSVKSTSRAIGADELSETAAQIEAAAKNSDADSLKEILPGFVLKYSDLGTELETALSKTDQD